MSERDIIKPILAVAIGGSPVGLKVASEIALNITSTMTDILQPLSRADFINFVKAQSAGLGILLASPDKNLTEQGSTSQVLAFSSVDDKNGIAMVMDTQKGTVSAYIGQPTSYKEADNLEATALLNAVEVCKDQPRRLVESKDLGKGKAFDVYEIDTVIYQPETLLLKQDLRSPKMTIPEAEAIMINTYGDIATFGKARITIATTNNNITGVTFKISRNEGAPTLPNADPEQIKDQTVRLYPLTLEKDTAGTEFTHDAGSQRFYMRGRISENDAAEATLPDEVQKKFDKAGIDTKNMTNATLDANGLQITFEDNEVITIPANELDARTTVRRDGTFQVLDKDGKNIEIAFDLQNNTFELKADHVYFPEDKKIDVNILKKVAPKDKLEAYRLEKLFFAEYPLDVFQPDPDKINTEWGSLGIFTNETPEGKYPASTPLGPGASEMLRLENVFIVEKDPTNGRPYDTIHITESIAINGQLEVMHFTMDMSEDSVANIVEEKISKKYILPVNAMQTSSYDNIEAYNTFRIAYEETGLSLIEDNGSYYFELGQLIIDSFKSGKISPFLTNYEMFGLAR